MRTLQFAIASALLAGCASGPVDLTGAKIIDVRVFAYTERPGVSSDTNVELMKAEQIPCAANEMRVAVEVRAIPAGASESEVFSSGGGLKERVKASPGDYKEFGIDDPYDYEQSHTFDMRQIDFTVSDAIVVERIGERGSGGMYSSSTDRLELEDVLFKLDQRKATMTGFELVTIPKFAPEKKVTKTWKPNRSCQTRTLINGAGGDLNHRRGDPGPRVTVYVTKANTEFGEVMLALVDHAKGSQYVLADLGAPHTFVAGGGKGVEGTSVEAGGDGGDGGTIQIVLDKRFAELEPNLKWEAPGGAGGRGVSDGRAGAPGQGTVKVSEDAIKVLAKRRDLPAGVTLIDPPPPEDPKPSKGTKAAPKGSKAPPKGPAKK